MSFRVQISNIINFFHSLPQIRKVFLIILVLCSLFSPLIVFLPPSSKSAELSKNYSSRVITVKVSFSLRFEDDNTLIRDVVTEWEAPKQSSYAISHGSFQIGEWMAPLPFTILSNAWTGEETPFTSPLFNISTPDINYTNMWFGIRTRGESTKDFFSPFNEYRRDIYFKASYLNDLNYKFIVRNYSGDFQLVKHSTRTEDGDPGLVLIFTRNNWFQFSNLLLIFLTVIITVFIMLLLNSMTFSAETGGSMIIVVLTFLASMIPLSLSTLLRISSDLNYSLLQNLFSLPFLLIFMIILAFILKNYSTGNIDSSIRGINISLTCYYGILFSFNLLIWIGFQIRSFVLVEWVIFLIIVFSNAFLVLYYENGLRLRFF